MNIGGQLLDTERATVMAILNITPDSFYEGSRLDGEEQVAQKAAQALREGAALLDLGGYSTRPGAAEVSAEQELERLDMAMRVIRQNHPQAFLSVDTFRSEIVERLFDKYGAFVVNDVSGGELDTQMISTAARLGLPYICGHMRGTPATMGQYAEYQDVTTDVLRYFVDKIAQARQAGLKDFIVDPCFGFSKNAEHNFQLLRELDKFFVLGKPLLAGISRKRFIYNTLGVTAEEALNGTTALHMVALQAGAKILRVHDTLAAVQTIKLYNKLWQ